MGLGDEILAAGHAQRVYDADPSKKVAICDVHNVPRDHDLWRGNPIIATPKEVQAKLSVHRIRNGSNCRPYIRYPFTNNSGWKFNRDWKARDHVGKLYLSPGELIVGQRLASVVGPYLMIEPSICAKSTRNKAWPVERWQGVVKACPDINFVQAIHPDSQPLAGVRPVRTASFRDACGLLAASVGYVGIEGAFHHAAKVLDKLAVVVVGGAVDWEVLGYPDHLGLVGDEPHTPCGSWKPCEHCKRALASITVESVVNGIRSILVPRLAGVVA